MLHWGLVDCEHWDLFSVWAGRHKMTEDERQQAEENRPARRREKEQAAEASQQLVRRQIDEIIAGGDPLLALRAHQRMAKELPDWSFPQPQMLTLIQRLHEKKLWAESVPLMGEYVLRYPQNVARVRLRLAQTSSANSSVPARR